MDEGQRKVFNRPRAAIRQHPLLVVGGCSDPRNQRQIAGVGLLEWMTGLERACWADICQLPLRSRHQKQPATARNGPLAVICKQRTKHIEFFIDISSPHFHFPIAQATSGKSRQANLVRRIWRPR